MLSSSTKQRNLWLGVLKQPWAMVLDQLVHLRDLGLLRVQVLSRQVNLLWHFCESLLWVAMALRWARVRRLKHPPRAQRLRAGVPCRML